MSGDGRRDDVLACGAVKVCGSQGGLVVWCWDRGGLVSVRDGGTGEVLAVVEKGVASVKFMKSVGGLMWVQQGSDTLKVYDAWSFALLKTFRTTTLTLAPASRSHTFLLSTTGTITFLTPHLTELPTPPLHTPSPTAAAPGGSYIFIATRTGSVHILSTTHHTFKGDWTAHPDTPIAHIACCSGYTITSARASISVWDPFPNDGSNRLASLLYNVDFHVSPVRTLVALRGDVCSVDNKGELVVWSVLPDEALVVSKKTLPEGLLDVTVSDGWSGLLVWSLCHDTAHRYIKIYNPSVYGLPERYIQAQSQIVTTIARVQNSIATAPARVNAMFSRHLLSVIRLHFLHFLGRDTYRKWRIYATRKINARNYATHIQHLTTLSRRVCYDKLARWQVEKKARRQRIHAALSALKEHGNHILRKYFMQWSRTKVRKLRLLQHLALASTVLEGAMCRALLANYFNRLLAAVLKRRGNVPRNNAVKTLLRCTVHGTILNVYRKWRRFASSRKVQRNMVDNSLARTKQGVRLVYYKKWMRWMAKRRRKSRFEEFTTTFGDLGLMYTYWRKLKMYGGWSAMVEMNALQEAAAKYFHELVDEERELMGDLVSVSKQSWPACAITSALGMNIEKWMKEGMVFFAGESQEYVGMKMVSEKLQDAWHKDGDILDELSENLVAPPGVNKNALLWQLCLDLHRKYGKVFKDRKVGPVEILAMRLYTLEGPDVDRHMGFGDVPPPFSSVPDNKKEALMAQWDEYKKLHSSVSKPTVSKVHIHDVKQGDRNPSIYSEMNKALRTSTDIQKWAKLSSLLLAMSMPIDRGENNDSSPVAEKALYRGIHNLPDAVMAAHRALQRGWSYAWLAPSSTSESMEASADFLKNTDAKYNILFKVSGCGEGLPLHKVSQFPDEAEVLLPPFSTFVVESEPVQCENYLEINLVFKGTLVQNSPEMMEFVTEVRDEAESAAERRYNLESTRQLQEVEQSARKFNEMERDLIIERVYAIHLRTVCKIRVHDLERRKYDVLQKIKKKQAEVDYKNSLAEKWRPSGKANELQATIFLLKARGVLNFVEDALLISRITTGFKTKKPLFTAKDAYNTIRGTVGMYAKGTKRKGELWPVGCVKRMTGLDLKKCVTAYKTLVVACENLTVAEYNELLALMERPLDSLPIMYEAMHAKTAAASSPLTPKVSFRSGKDSIGNASYATFSATLDVRTSPLASPSSSSSHSPYCTSSPYDRSRNPSVSMSLSPCVTPSGTPMHSPRRRSSGALRFTSPMSPATPIEDYLTSEDSSPRRLSRLRFSDAFKYDPLKEEGSSGGSPMVLPVTVRVPSTEEEALPVAPKEPSIEEEELPGVTVEAPKCELCGNDVRQPFCGATGRPHSAAHLDDEVTEIPELRLSISIDDPVDDSPPQEDSSDEPITLSRMESQRPANLVIIDTDGVLDMSPPPCNAERTPRDSSASRSTSRRASLDRAAGETGAALATSALFRVKDLISSGEVG